MNNKTAYIFSGQGFSFSELVHFGDVSFPPDIVSIYESIFERQLEPLGELTSESYRKNEISAAILMMSAFLGLEYNSPSPIFMAGFSVGQYIALYAAGALTRSELVTLVFKRCKYMNEAASSTHGAMVSVLGLSYDDVNELADANNVWISSDNAPGNVTVSGEVEALNVFCILARERGAYRVHKLHTSGAWHCPHMTLAGSELAAAVSEVFWKPTAIPVIDNVTVSEFEVANAQHQLVSHLTEAVRWRETIKYLSRQGVTHFLEISHFDLLQKMGPFITRKAEWKSVQSFKVQ